MLSYLIRRVLIMIPTLLAISAIVFIIIQLPPGDYLTTLVAELQSQGEAASLEKINFLRQQYGLDRSPDVAQIRRHIQFALGIVVHRGRFTQPQELGPLRRVRPRVHQRGCRLGQEDQRCAAGEACHRGLQCRQRLCGWDASAIEALYGSSAR